jgi:hypothetical protein
MIDSFSQKDVNQIFSHIPSRTIRWWGLMGLYQSSSETRDGRGISRLYSGDNLYQIGITEQLADVGIPVNIIRAIMNKIFFRSGHFPERHLPEVPKIREAREPEYREWSIETIMGFTLLIAKTPPRLQKENGSEMTPGWRYALGHLELAETETALFTLFLDKIKRVVDELVAAY